MWNVIYVFNEVFYKSFYCEPSYSPVAYTYFHDDDEKSAQIYSLLPNCCFFSSFFLAVICRIELFRQSVKLVKEKRISRVFHLRSDLFLCIPTTATRNREENQNKYRTPTKQSLALSLDNRDFFVHSLILNEIIIENINLMSPWLIDVWLIYYDFCMWKCLEKFQIYSKSFERR